MKAIEEESEISKSMYSSRENNNLDHFAKLKEQIRLINDEEVSINNFII